MLHIGRVGGLVKSVSKLGGSVVSAIWVINILEFNLKFMFYRLTSFTSDGIPPYAYVALPKLNFRQRHDISVDLLVPFTSSNLLLGNFMTSLTLTTSSNKTLAHVRRPVRSASSIL